VVRVVRGLIVMDYVLDYYGALHTTGAQYTIEDIDEFIASRKGKPENT
jgi:hypothetical protein